MDYHNSFCYFRFNGITGFILWAVLIAICLISPNRMRQIYAKHPLTVYLASFDIFWWTHYLMGPLFFLITFYHGTHKTFPNFPDHDVSHLPIISQMLSSVVFKKLFPLFTVVEVPHWPCGIVLYRESKQVLIH